MKKGLSAFQEAVRIEPHTARVHVGLGFACLKLEKYQEALQHFRAREEVRCKNESRLVRIGGHLCTTERLRDCRRDFESSSVFRSRQPNRAIQSGNSMSRSQEPRLCPLTIQPFKDDGRFVRQDSLHHNFSRSSRGCIHI